MFYIQNKGYAGNCLKWWRINGQGYTCNIDEAWKVSKDEAKRICNSRPTEDLYWPVEVVDAMVVRHVPQGRKDLGQPT